MDGAPCAVLGIYVRDGSAEAYSALVLPFWFYEFLRPDLETYITQVELVAAVAAYYTFPDMLRGRAVVHFVDNTGALSAMVHGYARKPDCARLVNAYHAQSVALRCLVWGEWVPSKANPADIPTRSERDGEMPASAVWREMVLPPLKFLEGHVGEWIAYVRSR